MDYGKLQADVLVNFDNQINVLRQQLFKGRPADEEAPEWHTS